MSRLHRTCNGRNGNTPPAASWPAWTDGIRAELPPDAWPHWTNLEVPRPVDDDVLPAASDLDWAAVALNESASDYDLLEAAVDQDAAFYAAALDSLERGLIPQDIALMINNTSLAGSDADEICDRIMHSGSDSRWCLCSACTWRRTSRYCAD